MSLSARPYAKGMCVLNPLMMTKGVRSLGYIQTFCLIQYSVLFSGSIASPHSCFRLPKKHVSLAHFAYVNLCWPTGADLLGMELTLDHTPITLI